MIIGRAIVTCFGETHAIILESNQTYSNGRPAIRAIEDGAPFGIITTNIPEYDDLKVGEFLVKTWSENEWVPQLLESGLFEDTNKRVSSGFVEAQVWRMK